MSIDGLTSFVMISFFSVVDLLGKWRLTVMGSMTDTSHECNQQSEALAS